MKTFVGTQDSFSSADRLRQQIATTLRRWENQDYRVDLNWTNFEHSVVREKVKFNRDFRRYLRFGNRGNKPVYIKNIIIDKTHQRKCSDFWEILKVVNCDEFIGRRLGPNDEVELALQYHETFQFLRN